MTFCEQISFQFYLIVIHTFVNCLQLVFYSSWLSQIASPDISLWACFFRCLLFINNKEFYSTAQNARLAQLVERRSAEREVVSSNPGRTNTQGLKITEEKVLSL